MGVSENDPDVLCLFQDLLQGQGQFNQRQRESGQIDGGCKELTGTAWSYHGGQTMHAGTAESVYTCWPNVWDNADNPFAECFLPMATRAHKVNGLEKYLIYSI